MSASYAVKQPGYAYMYISNEQAYQTDVYFDDVTMTFTASPVVQQQDFYAFGLSFNSYSRQSSVPQNYLYNGKELQNDLSLDWYDYGARMYMPEIGRWGVIDPLSEKSRRWSPYNYCSNNPIRLIDPDGMEDQGSNDYDTFFKNWGKEEEIRAEGKADDEAFTNAQGQAMGDTQTSSETLDAFQDSNNQDDAHDWDLVFAKKDSKKNDESKKDTSDEPDEDGQASQGDPTSTLQILHASPGWDWFLQTSTWTSDNKTFTIKHGVIITYNTNAKDWGTSRYGQVTSLISQKQVSDQYGVINPGTDDNHFSSEMNQLIQDAEDYHCGGCITAPSVLNRYLEFIFSPANDAPINRSTIGPPHR